MSTPIAPGDKCPCGQPLPWHLLELGVGVMHICSCERTVVPVNGGYEIPEQRTPNPFARAEWNGSLQKTVDKLQKTVEGTRKRRRG